MKTSKPYSSYHFLQRSLLFHSATLTERLASRIFGLMESVYDNKHLSMKLTMRRLGISGLCVSFLSGCSSEETLQIERPLPEIYTKAYHEFGDKNYDKAFDEFTEVERQYPYSPWAAKAQLMAAYTAYKDQNFERSIGALDNFISLHPYHNHVSYAYYLRALCYYDDVASVDKDPRVAENALEALTELINRFPQTLYARDAQFKRDYIRSHLAGKQMTIGRFYLNHKEYIAAFLRFQNVIQNHLVSSHTPEALHRLVECSLALGLRKEALQAACVLGENFPQSEWYSDTYALMEGKNVPLACDKAATIPSSQQPLTSPAS